MAIKFKEIRASKIYTDGIYTAAGEPTNTTAHNINGTLAVSGASTLTGNTAVGGTLGVTSTSSFTGAVTCGNTLSTAGAATLASAIVTGSLAANGGITCDTNKFIVADTTGNTTVGGTLSVTGVTAHTGLTRTLGGIQTDITAVGNVKALITDGSGNAIVASCLTANIPSAVAGYACGCMLLVTTAGAAGELHVNKGTVASCTFTKVTQA